MQKYSRSHMEQYNKCSNRPHKQVWNQSDAQRKYHSVSLTRIVFFHSASRTANNAGQPLLPPSMVKSTDSVRLRLSLKQEVSANFFQYPFWGEFSSWKRCVFSLSHHVVCCAYLLLLLVSYYHPINVNTRVKLYSLFQIFIILLLDIM